MFTTQEGGGEELVSRWAIITESLSQPLRTVADIKKAVLSYNYRYREKWSFSGLHRLLEQV